MPISMIIFSALQCWQYISKHSSILDWLPSKTAIPAAHVDMHAYTCSHSYTTELLSIDPLVIYINNFIHDEEIEHLLNLGQVQNDKFLYCFQWLTNITHFRKDKFRESRVFSGSGNFGDTIENTVRQSQTAVLPRKDPVCACLTKRMMAFLGNVQHMEVEALQVVKYDVGGDQFKPHMDWFDTPMNDSSYGPDRESYKPSNRLGTIFAYLDDNCTRGETYFPNLPGVSESADGSKFALAEGDTGLLVKPQRGNAIFWNNLLPDGSGDVRVLHAGLPVESGTKVGLNMWSRYFFDQPMVGGN